jgi:hypothetical protein
VCSPLGTQREKENEREMEIHASSIKAMLAMSISRMSIFGVCSVRYTHNQREREGEIET